MNIRHKLLYLTALTLLLLPLIGSSTSKCSDLNYYDVVVNGVLVRLGLSSQAYPLIANVLILKYKLMLRNLINKVNITNMSIILEVKAHCKELDRSVVNRYILAITKGNKSIVKEGYLVVPTPCLIRGTCSLEIRPRLIVGCNGELAHYDLMPINTNIMLNSKSTLITGRCVCGYNTSKPLELCVLTNYEHESSHRYLSLIHI